MSASPPTSPSQHAAAHAYASNGLEILQAASDAAQAIQDPQALQNAAAAAAEAVSQQQQQQQQHEQGQEQGQEQEQEQEHHVAADAISDVLALSDGPVMGQQLPGRSAGAVRDPSVNPKLTRLRRACDLCSRRKVKCDDSNVPCRPCRELGADCTWERETKRRGPPNKHVEAAKAAKRARLEMTSATISASPSPQTAAKALMDISADGILDAEIIAPMPVLELLVDDFFTYIHPVAPFPHEPTFRQSFANREDRTKPEFLGLLASMIGTLVASFPRSAREYLKTQRSAHLFPKASLLVEKCRDIALMTRGSKWAPKKPKSLDDACTSYFLGLAGTYTLEWDLAEYYLAETLVLLRGLGFKRRATPGELPTFGADSYSQESLPFNHVKDQTGKRLFWCLLLSARSLDQLCSTRSLSQLGLNGADLVIFPPTPSSPYPDYPENVDDICILANEIIHQAEGSVTLLTGFRFGIDIYTTMNGIVSLELAYGMSTLRWADQRGLLRDGLMAAKSITENLPPELQLTPQGDDGNSLAALDESGLQYVPAAWPNAQPAHDIRNVIKTQPPQRRRLQHEIQKANIFMSQLATRSYFVDMYFNLRDVHLAEKQQGDMIKVEAEELQALQDVDDEEIHELMATERELIVQNLLEIVGSVSQRNVEPNGMSLIYKMRQVASTLVNDAPERKGPVATRSDEVLAQLVDILAKLEKTGPAAASRAADPTQVTAEDEEEELRYWAELREFQLRLAATGGFAGLV
ncbi:Zn(2)-C6 fungal-type DNA-binding domain protein [Moelleriella libera RCEF 2490]|uniref:Zn(2)-C6 fungal-type DNA-binding domain protein n=1 Tax=Moelleriella libera RCEF 2490 TaxID=1081109 RepID=A0A167Y521_9HYPO|nr:Zn(2)-C6 fungal-type DNA-binding domain protein [Moelleriella libera RCEF 2490]